MAKIIDYYLIYQPGGTGSVHFRLHGEDKPKVVVLNAIDFCAVAAVLAQKNIDFENGSFRSYDNDPPFTNNL